jgi:hypothetical protein
MNSSSFARKSIPKVAVLAAGLTVAAMAATVHPTDAQAFPSRNRDCSACHNAGGTTTARASTTTPAAGASYTVAVAMTANPRGGTSGYAIVPVTAGSGTTNGGGSSAALSYTATMKAPTTPGKYTYQVFTNQGGTGSAGHASGARYTITVAAAPVAVTTTTTLTMAPTAATAVAPASRTLTAAVTGAGAAGTVAFFNGATSLGTRTLTSGSASLALSNIGVGSYSYHAVFTPTSPAKFTSSSSGNRALTVTAPPPAPGQVLTTTALRMSPSTATAQAPAVRILTAAVKGAGAAGTVKFFNGVTPVGTSTVTAGSASLTLNRIGVGTYSFHAVFTPTSPALFTSSISANVALKVTAAPVPVRAVIRSLSRNEAQPKQWVALRGTGFGAKGVVRFGSASARVISWTTTKIVVVVPNVAWPSRTSDELEVQVMVTPKGGVASRGVEFEIKR